MATRFYLQDAAATLTGTLPSGTQTGIAPDVTVAGAATVRKLKTAHDSSTILVNIATLPSTGQQSTYIRTFATDPLAAQTIRNFYYGSTPYFGCGDLEADLNANFWVACIGVYVWRPSTGAVVGWLSTPAASLYNTRTSGGEPGVAGEIFGMVNSSALKSSAISVNCQDGDIIVAEIWSQHTQALANAYSTAFVYGGSVDPTSAAQVFAAVGPASFLEFPDNLVFLADTLAPQGIM